MEQKQEVVDPAIKQGQNLDPIPSTNQFWIVEYEAFTQWALHGESAIHKVFNFYITLLASAVGGLALLLTIGTFGLRPFLLIIAGIAAVMLLIGIALLDALIGQYKRNVYYHIGLLTIKEQFQLSAESEESWPELPPFKTEGFIGRRYPVFRRIAPVGAEQIFMTLINSLLVMAIMLCISWAVAGIGHRPGRTIVVIIVAFALSFFAHNFFVRVGLQGLLDKARRFESI